MEIKSNSSTSGDKRKKAESKQTPNEPKTENYHKEEGDDAKSSKKNHCEEEMKRLRKKLQQTADKIKERKPSQKDFQPDTFNALEPYCDLHDAEFLFERTDDRSILHGYSARYTAIEVPDPWISHRMDVEIPPKTKPQRVSNGQNRDASSESKSSDMEDGRQNSSSRNNSNSSSNNVAPHSTYTIVGVEAKSLNKKNKTWLFTDVPNIRKELSETKEKTRKDDGYDRTKSDFYRMKLDQMDKYSARNRSTMKEAYFAYLQNTPGSKRAIKECVEAEQCDVKDSSQSKSTAASSKLKPSSASKSTAGEKDGLHKSPNKYPRGPVSNDNRSQKKGK